MGNSLDCPTLEPLLNTADGVWRCSGNTLPNSCVFPFTAIPSDGGSSVVFGSCVQFSTFTPPAGLDDTSEINSDAFWCPSVDTLHSASASAANSSLPLVSLCSCVELSKGDVEEEADMLWALGVFFSILSSVATTVGTLLQKISHRINDAKPEGKKAPEIGGILFSPAWLGAFALMVLLPLPFDFIALALAAQSLLVVFAGLTIALNVPMARVMLDERPDRLEKIATGVILVGLIFTTASGPKNDMNVTACDLLQRYTESDFVAAVFILSSCLVVVLYLVHWAPKTPVLVRMSPIMYAFCAGGFGGLGNIAFKAIGELAEAGLSTEGRDVGAWKTIHPYYHVLIVIIISTAQISHINQGLKRYDAVLYVPLYNCMYILLSGTMGAITFKEFEQYTTMQWIFFPTGVAITLVGIIIMSMKDPTVNCDESKITPMETLKTEKKAKK